MLLLAAGSDAETNHRRARKAKPLSVDQILNAVAEHHGVDPLDYYGFCSPAGGRDLAAFHCRRYSGVTLRELSSRFGLSHPDGAANLVRRAKARLAASSELQRECLKIEWELGLKTEDQV